MCFIVAFCGGRGSRGNRGSGTGTGGTGTGISVLVLVLARVLHKSGTLLLLVLGTSNKIWHLTGTTHHLLSTHSFQSNFNALLCLGFLR